MDKLHYLDQVINKAASETAHLEPTECASTHFSQSERDSIAELSEVRHHKKGDVLIKENQIVTECFHVITGCIRQYSLVDGEEKTTFFYLQDDSILSFSTGSEKNVSTYYLDCVEDTTVSVMTSDHERELYRRHPRIESLSRISLEQQIKEFQNVLSVYMTSSPEERYTQILRHKPSLLNKVPQYQLASYIGVKPESLSRIRKRMAESKSV